MMSECRSTVALPSLRKSKGSCLSIMLILVGCIWLYPQNLFADDLFRCTEASGTIVFTDSPVQLGTCTRLSLGKLSTSRGINSASSTIRSTKDSVVQNPHSLGKASSLITVPVEKYGPLLVVSTTLNNGYVARFILDTGASLSIISKNLATDIGLLPTSGLETITLKTAGGPVQADIITIPSIRLSAAEVKNSAIAIFDLPDIPEGIEGILGLTFLRHFEVTLDIAKGQLHLRPPTL